MRRVVITGGTHSGKSSLLEALGAGGFATVPEAALILIRELNEALGVEEQARWRRAHPGEFQGRVARLQRELEARAEPRRGDVVFCDRGVLDGLAYCRTFSVPPPPVLLEALREHRYSRVFVLETLTPFDTRAETGRTSDEATSRRFAELLTGIYRDAGYAPVRVPVLPLAERVEHVLNELALVPAV